RIHRAIVLTACVILLLSPFISSPQHAPSSDGSERDSSLLVGEELTYNVSYASYDLGRVKISVTDRVNESGTSSYKTLAKIDTYDGVPFVTVHTTFESRIDRRVFSHAFRKRNKSDAEWQEVAYDFSYPSKKVTIQYFPVTGRPAKKAETLPIDTLYQDGL